ncbi:MAG TPA: TIGR03086 family metal-binding protein [Nocardioides sp.]|nr:TIGR03086 family metal-binding protein [Nocardioides sp.]
MDMTNQHQAVVVLSRAIDQAGDVLASIHADEWDRPTPCNDWTVRQLAAHLAVAPEHFLQQARGEEVDWVAEPEVADGQWAGYFRNHGDDLLHHWHEQPDDQAAQADWQSAELGVHTWDLVRALGRPQRLDDEVAERGLAFMRQGLTPDNRGAAFGPEVEAPDDASAYDRLAAFAGRDPRA